MKKAKHLPIRKSRRTYKNQLNKEVKLVIDELKNEKEEVAAPLSKSK